MAAISLLSKDASGRNLKTKLPILPRSATVADAKKLIIENSKSFDSISYIYILSKANHLLGVVSIHEVFSRQDELSIGDIMAKDIVKVHTKTDREKAARLAVKHNIKAIPVVDEKEKFVGAITSDQLLNILDQESEEDLLKLSGIIFGKDHIEEHSNLPIEKSFIKRVPWIIVGLIGALITARMIAGFQGILSEHIILASFIPLVAYIANAVGTQTQTLFIRDLSVNIKEENAGYIARQLLVSLLIALASWLFIVMVTAIFWSSVTLGVVVGMAFTVAIINSTILALLIPSLMDKLGIDPAVGSGPFSTVFQDFLSVFIYFSIASAFYG